MLPILKEVLEKLPSNKISEAGFEGANIVLYTKDEDFYKSSNGEIKRIVDEIKKRIELRPDPSITMEQEEAEDKINEIIPKDAKISNIVFDPQRSMVVVESEKPGLAIGKRGEVLREIRDKTLWVPLIKRTPAIRSKIIENIRQVLYENNDYRKKFLNKVGERIYAGYTRERKDEWVRVTFLGAARQVGRSCFLLQTPESRVILDCGINVAAPEAYAYPFLDAPEFKLDELDAVVVSHSHVDHSALVPYLYKMGYRGPTYCTLPTRDVSALLALDTIGIAFKEVKKALYSSSDVKEMVKHTITLDYEEVTDITPDIRMTLYNAGHILGSAMVHLHVGNGLHNILYTGDFKYGKTALLEPAPTEFPRLETVIMECTYGGKDNIGIPRKDVEKNFMDTIKRTLDRGGKVLIPTLGVGRAQEVQILIERMLREKLIEKVPVFVHGMVWDITAIHTAYPDFLSNNVRRAIFHKDENPFLSEVFQRVGSFKEQQQVIEEKGPCIIMATSGMLTGGPSVSYFKALADNPNNTMIFVNYLGEGSLGRQVQRGDKEVYVEDEKEKVKVNMEIVTLDGLSGHSDRNQLTSFIHRLRPSPKKVILVHGENSKCLELASTIHKQHRIETNAPKNLESIRIR